MHPKRDLTSGRVGAAGRAGRVVSICLALLALVTPAYPQQTLTWDPNGAAAGTGGGGAWNTSSLLWFTGVVHQAWNNVAQDDAVFGGTASGIVTLGGPISAHSLTFNTTGYTVASNTLTLGGASPTFNVAAGIATISSAVAGSAGLNTTGAGTLVLTGANTYSGGTTIANGTLQVGSGGAAGTLGTGAVTNNGALIFDRNNALTVAGAIGGTGTLTQAGTNVLTLTGANTYSGATTIESGGTLSVGAGAGIGDLSATSQIINNGTLQLNRTGTLTLAAGISGTGNVTKLATGVVTVTGTNTYAGSTTISGGTLEVGNGGTTGTVGAGNITVTGATSLLRINRSDTVTLGQVISGTGGLTQAGLGTTVLIGANTYGAATTIAGGTLQVGAGGTTGTLGTGAVVNTGAVVFNRSDVATVANLISGAGTVTHAGSGTVVLTGANTYSGGTTIAGGTLQVGNGATGTLGTGAVTNNGVLIFNRNNALTVAGAIGGTGTLTQAGTNVLSLTGTNTYSGVTTIASGTLSVGAGGATGSLGASNQVINNGTLQLNRTGTLTLAAGISGTGNVTKLAAGVVTLTGTNTYAGPTTISGGTLEVGNGGTTGTVGAGNITVTGATSLLRINRSDTVTLGQVISGTGGLAQAGTGTTVLTGANTYGATTVTVGTLRVGDGSTSGTLGTGAVVNSSAVVFDRSDVATVGNLISGAGTVTHAGSGTVVLTGANTYSGGTTIAIGTLQVGTGGTTGTLGTGAVTNNGALVFDHSTAQTVASAIGGTGTLTQAGTSVLSLTGANTYTGATTIESGGTLSVGAGAGIGDLGATSQITNNGTLQLNRTGALTLAADISGTGNVTKLATGVVTVTGTNTYAGTTTISGGTLQVGNGGTTGTVGAGNITVTGTTSLLRINRSDILTLGQVISGTGGLTQAGLGTTVLTGANTYSAATTITTGTLQVGTGGTTGTLGTGAVVNTGAVVFNRSDGVTVANVISGAGTVTHAGSGTVVLTGANTYSGGTTIASGTLQVGTGGTAGTLGTGAVINNGALIFDRNNALTVAGAIGGTGTLTQAGTNVLTLTGANTYSGATTIESGGTLSVGAGAGIGDLSATSQIINNGTLQLNRTGTLTLAAGISGTGNVTKLATGVVTVTGTNTYAGSTTISGGTLEVGNGGTTGTVGAGNITVTGATSLLRINRSDTVTLGQVISGTGGLTQAGLGTTMLTGANTYGAATTIAGGTLQVGAGGTTGTLGTGAVVNTGAVVFNRSDVATVANLISGAGTVTHAGSGTVVLTGANTYSGGTTIAGGTLQVGSGGTTGTLGTGAVTNNGALVFDHSTAQTVASAIGGTGTLTQAGTSVLSLTGTNSYTGATTIESGGRLSVGAGAAIGDLGATSQVINNGTLQLNRTGTLTLAVGISGTGNVTKLAAGVVTLTGTNTYAGPTTISGGTLEVGNGGTTGTLGAGAIMVTGATSVLRINRSDTLTLGQVISGPGGLTQAGSGTTVLTGANTYSAATTITAGTLQVGTGGTTGTLGTGAVVNDGAVVFNRSDGATIANVISGAGTVTHAGSGTVALTGANTYSGGTTIASGTLQVGAGGATGTLGTGAVTNNGALVFDHSTAQTVASVIGGTGTLTQAGTNVLSLTGTNTYSGVTTIASGTLSVGAGGTSGSLGSGSVNVNASAILAFDRSDAHTIVNAITGSGAISQIGSGVTTLAAASNTVGSTHVTAGTLDVDGTLNTATVTVGEGLLNIDGTVQASGITQSAFANVAGSSSRINIGSGASLLASGDLGDGADVLDVAGTLNTGGGTFALGDGDDIFMIHDGTGVIGIVDGGAGLDTFNTNIASSATLGAVQGFEALDKTGIGTLNIVGPAVSGFSSVNISAGTLNLANTSALSGVQSTTVRAGATLIAAGSYSGSAGNDTMSVSGAVVGPAIDLGDGDDLLDLAGVFDTAGGTLGFASGNDTMRLQDQASVAGILDGGAGVDRLTLAGIGSGTLDVGTIGAAGTYRNFEQFFKEDIGTWTLIGTDSNPRPLDWTVSAGTFVVNTASLRGNVMNDGAVHFNQTTTGTYAGAISGSGSMTKLGTGTLTLSGASTYSGPTAVTGGTLLVNGSLGNTAVSVAPGARLGGTGAISGIVTIDSGATLAPGLSPGTLTVGSLNLMDDSILDYELATPGVIGGGVNDLVVVAGDLMLDGTLNVMGLPGFGIGTYRLIDYGASLVDNQLSFGLMPLGYAYQLRTTVPGQVNLAVVPMSSDPTQYWDGGGPSANHEVNGGSGAWAAGLANWTDSTATSNQAWGGRAAVFAGNAGTVTVAGHIDFTSLDFRTGGYALVADVGATLNTTTADTLVRAGSGVTTIGVPITGSGGLNVRGDGRLILTGSNTYRGGTKISGGTLSVSSDRNLGAASGRLRFDGGTLDLTGDVISGRATSLATAGGTIKSAGGTTSIFAGDFDGSGSLRKSGKGSLVLTGAGTYSGGTVIEDGTLQIGNCGAAGSVTGDVKNDSMLIFSRSDVTTIGGSISGSGTVVKACGGTLIATGDNTYSGGTLVSAGTLQGDSRSLQGDIVDDAALIFDQALDGVFSGSLFGTGTVAKRGTGTLFLTGAHGVQGLSTVEQGTLAFDGVLPGGVAVNTGATFDATGAIGGALTVDGAIHVRRPVAGGFGRLSVGGDVVLNAGSQYRVDLDASGNNAAIVSNSRAKIDGATISVAPQADDYGRVTQYAVFRAGNGLSGTAVASSVVATLEPYLTQNDTTLFVTLLRMDLPLEPNAMSPNGSAIGGALDRVKGSASGDLARVVRELTALDDVELARGLDITAGEVHASAVHLAAMDGDGMVNVVRGEIASRTSPVGSERGRSADPSIWRTQGRRVWVRARTERTSLSTDTAHGGRSNLSGYAIGADWVMRGQWLVGVGASYADGRLVLEGVDESANVTAPRAVGYAGYGGTRWALSGGVSVARTAYDTRRRFYFSAIAPTGGLLFGGVDREAVSQPSGLASDFWGEVRFDLDLGHWNAQPIFGVRRASYALGEWSEAGADSLSLNAEAQSIASTQADAGIRVGRAFGGFYPFVSAMHRRELTDGRTMVSLRLGRNPEGRFDVDGLRFASDTTALEAGFIVRRRNIWMSLWYEARRARQEMRHVVQFGIGFE